MALFTLMVVSAQEHKEAKLHVYGGVESAATKQPLNGAIVLLEKNGEVIEYAKLRGNNKYHFILEYGEIYKISYTKTGYVTRAFIINTKKVPKSLRKVGQIIDIELDIFQLATAVDFDYEIEILKKPIGKGKYNKESQDISFSFEYTKSIRDSIAIINDIVRERSKE